MNHSHKKSFIIAIILASCFAHVEAMHFLRKFENIKAYSVRKNAVRLAGISAASGLLSQHHANQNQPQQEATNNIQARNQKPQLKTIDDLKKEAEINIYVGKCILGQTKFVGAPTSLLIALNKLNSVQSDAINAYHKAIIENAPIDTRAKLHRNVQLLIRDEDERAEILDNLRWLQRDNSIAYVQKFTPDHYKFLPFLSFLLPMSMFPFNTTPLIIKAISLSAFPLGFLGFAHNDEQTAHNYRVKHQGKNKFTLNRGII